MAFDRNRLVKTGPHSWRYKTTDAATTVDTAGYFNEKSSSLKLGDIIERLTVTNIDASNEAVSSMGRHIVNSVTRTAGTSVIDVADEETVPTTDSR